MKRVVARDDRLPLHNHGVVTMSGLAHASKDELEGRPEETPMPSVLIVDDDPDFQAAMAELVSGEGFTVETAASLAEAHAIFYFHILDVVLVDLTLPDGNGLA